MKEEKRHESLSPRLHSWTSLEASERIISQIININEKYDVQLIRKQNTQDDQFIRNKKIPSEKERNFEIEENYRSQELRRRHRNVVFILRRGDISQNHNRNLQILWLMRSRVKILIFQLIVTGRKWTLFHVFNKKKFYGESFCPIVKIKINIEGYNDKVEHNWKTRFRDHFSQNWQCQRSCDHHSCKSKLISSDRKYDDDDSSDTFCSLILFDAQNYWQWFWSFQINERSVFVSSEHEHAYILPLTFDLVT